MPAAADTILNALANAPQPLRTPAMRRIARGAALDLADADAEAVFDICDDLVAAGEYASGARAAAFEIAHRHRGLRGALDWRKLERLGRTLDGWDSVDHFARLLSGPAWQRGQISDARIHRWARSTDLWRRRAAIVSTIALNERHLGSGDAGRTLAVCEHFIDFSRRHDREGAFLGSARARNPR